MEPNTYSNPRDNDPSRDNPSSRAEPVGMRTESVRAESLRTESLRSEGVATGRDYARDHGREHAESIPSLIRGLAYDLATLFSKELSLAKAEMREAAQEAKAGVTSMATGVGLLYAGLLITLLAAVYGLDQIMELWLSALIVGLVSLLIGYLMIKAGSSKMEPSAFRPDRAMDSVRRDKDTVRRAV